MKIIIVGAGKIGTVIAEKLCREGHDITVIDNREDRVNQIGERFDIMTIQGNGSTYEVLTEAGVDTANLLIAATPSDELNLLCCLIAKKLGARHTIARVGNSEFNREIQLIKKDLGLSMAFNPEMATAVEMTRILRVPAAVKIDTFAKGRVELLKVRVATDSALDGISLVELGTKETKLLVCAVERGENEVYIPSGNFRLQAGDLISVIAKPKDAYAFFKHAHINAAPVRRLMLVGGGKIAYYIANIMLDLGVSVKIIENNPATCELLADALPEATIIHGDGTDRQLLLEEGITQTDAVVSLTGVDEENILMSLYAEKQSDAKVITKVNRLSFTDIVASLELSSVVYPCLIAAETVCRYVRALQNSVGSNVETLHQIVDGKAEALEFRVNVDSKVCNIPLCELTLRKNLLIATINRGGKIITPRGNDEIRLGDTVIVVTTNTGLNDLDDILENKG